MLVVLAAAPGCTDSRGTTVGFEGACFGQPYGGTLASCGELFNDEGRSYCELHQGCEWEDCEGTCGFCSGTYLGCGNRADEAGCAVEPGCGWYAPPSCATWTECAVLWLESGGCAEVEGGGIVGFGRGDESVTIADYCP